MADKNSGRFGSAVRTARPPLRLACALVVLSLLHGCGGGGGANDIAEAMGCAFANCKDSPDVSMSDISTSYEVLQDGSHVTVTSFLGYRYNLITVVRLRGGDSLVASIGSQSRQMLATDSTLMNFAASFDAQPATPTVSVDFHRGAQVERSTVTLPKAFVLLNPLGPVTLPLSAGQLLVDVSAPPEEPVTVQSSGSCLHTDGTTSVVINPVDARFVSANGSGSRYRVDTAALDGVVNAPSAAPGQAAVPKVTRCDLELKWQRVVEGSSSPNVHPSSKIRGVTQQLMTLHYDAQS